MDPIILLLVSQLLVITAIILTNARLKDATAFVAIKTRVFSCLVTAIGFNIDEGFEDIDTSLNEADVLSPRKPVFNGSYTGLKTRSGQSTSHKSMISQTLKSAIRQKFKINDFQKSSILRPTTETNKATMDTDVRLFDDYSNPSWFATLSAHRLVTWISGTRLFKILVNSKNSLECSNLTKSALKLPQPRLIESNFLTKIIATRKSEKVIRAKLARINSAIMRSRRARPLHVIPEIREPPFE